MRGISNFVNLLVSLIILLLPVCVYPLEIRGTLITSIPTRDGLVIVADKMVNDRKRGDQDTVTKIIPISKFVVFTTTGCPEILDANTFEPSYSVKNIVMKFYSLYKGNLSDSYTPLSKELLQEFNNFLGKTDYLDWPESIDYPDNCLFQVTFFSFNEIECQFHTDTIRFLYEKKFPNPSIRIMLYKEPSESFAYSKLFVFGKTAVFEEIMHGHDSRFDDLRSHNEIKRFLFQQAKIKDISKNEGVRFCKFFIRESGRLDHLIEPSPFHIGITVDAGIIDKKKGFLWLERNSSK